MRQSAKLQALGVRYVGPFDGHNVEELEHAFQNAIELSDEDWKMVETERPASWMAEKVRAAMPGTPMRPLPATVTRVSLSFVPAEIQVKTNRFGRSTST